MRLSEKLLIAQTALIVGFASWAFGGRVSWASVWIIAIAAGGLIPLLLSFHEERRETQQRSQVPPRCQGTVFSWRLVPWLILAALIVISFFNGSYRGGAPESGGGLILREHIEWLPSTVFPARTAESFGTLAAPLFQGLLVFQVAQGRRTLRLLLVPVCANALLLAVVGTFFHLLGSDRILDFHFSPNPFFFATFVYKNHWAAFCLLAICASLGLFFHGFARRQHAARATRNSPLPFFVAAPILLALTIPLAGSRSGTGLLFLIFVAVIAKVGGQLLRRADMSSQRKRIAAALLTAAFAGVVGYGYALAETSIQGGLRTTEQQVQAYLEFDQLEDRFYISRDTWNMAAAKPAYGWGLGSFPLVIPAYQGDEFRDPETGEISRYFVDAHNDWLQFLSEIGWLGLILLLAPPFLIFCRYFARGAANAFSRWLLFGCGLVLTYAIFDFPFQNPAVFLLFSILFAAAMRYGLIEQRPRLARGAPESGPARPPRHSVCLTNRSHEALAFREKPPYYHPHQIVPP